jgi:hypothetical protein
MSKMRVAIPPFLQYVFMAWCLVKQRDNFTFTFLGVGDLSEDVGVYSDVLEWILEKRWKVFIWIRIGTSGGLL